MFDSREQNTRNQQALDNPRPGDYWQEMFCPYFIVVDVKGDEYTVLSCMGGPDSYNRKDEPNARISVDSGHWAFDYSKSMIVDRAWIERAVKYGTIDEFVADVINSDKTQSIVTEWRRHKQQTIKAEILRLQSEWEEFTGWKYLKEEVSQ